MRLLRTIRLDPSDTFVFERAAEPGEWAVSGAFLFAEEAAEAAELSGKRLAAFRGGFLGAESFGWSTLVQIVDASDSDRAALVETLVQRLLADFGAPDIAAACAAAEDEVAFAASLCDHPAGTLIAVRRQFEDGAIREAFRSLHARGERKPMRAFSFLDVEGEDNDEPGEAVDLAQLAAAPQPHKA